MLLYNITTKVDTIIAQEWLQWQKETHIPEVMATGLFYKYQLYRLLEQDDTEGITYATQFFTDSVNNYKKYIQHFATGLREKATRKWGNQVVSFQTLLQNVN